MQVFLKRLKNNLLTFCPSVIQTNQLKTLSKVSDTIKLSLQITIMKELLLLILLLLLLSQLYFYVLLIIILIGQYWNACTLSVWSTFSQHQKNDFSNLQFRGQAVSPKFQVSMPCPSHLRQIQLGHGLILHCFNEFNWKSYEFPVCVPCSYQHCLSSREKSLNW